MPGRLGKSLFIDNVKQSYSEIKIRSHHYIDMIPEYISISVIYPCVLFIYLSNPNLSRHLIKKENTERKPTI